MFSINDGVLENSRLCPVSSVQEFYSEGAGRVVRTVGMTL